MFQELSAFASNLRRLIPDSLRSGALQSDPSVDGFESLALRAFQLQHALNPSFRSLCEVRGVNPESVRDWRSIPTVPTSAFKELLLTCLPESDRTHYFESSGTTKVQRSRTFHSTESLQLYEASLLPWFRHHVVPETCRCEPGSAPLMRFISLTPPLSQASHSSLVHMLDTVSRQGWVHESFWGGLRDAQGAWLLDVQRTQVALDEAVRDQVPVLLAGTAFNFVHLADALNAMNGGCSLPAGSRIMETGGYKGRSREVSGDELHRELTRMLDVPPANIVNEYGMTELGSQAYDQVAGDKSAKRILQFPPWARASVVSSETGCEVAEGEIGLVKIVDLANAFSVIALETEDLAIRRADGIELVGRNAQAEPRGCSLMAV